LAELRKRVTILEAEVVLREAVGRYEVPDQGGE